MKYGLLKKFLTMALSRPSRGAWIEMPLSKLSDDGRGVAPLAGRVD